MVESYANKLCLVTGGSSGIGLAVACELARRGAHVWITARNDPRMKEAVRLIDQAKASPSQQTGYFQADLQYESVVNIRLQAFQKKEGVPDLLVNCAGFAHPGLVDETAGEVFRQNMDANYYGTVYVTSAVLPGMIARGSGSIINFASAAALVGLPGYAAYGASKSAVRAYTDSLRLELKPKGINVSIVFPTDVDTPQLAYENRYKPALTLDVEALMGVTRPGKPEEVARVVLDAAARRRYIILPGGDAKFVFFLVNLLGSGIYPFGDLIVRLALRRQQRRKSPPAPTAPPQ